MADAAHLEAQTYGRYEVIARVGRGGMGTVYLARAVGEGGFHRLFILKVLHEHLGSDPNFLEMMQREARLAARLHHPNVVSIVDVGTQGDCFYIVMDYVEGCTLADLLNHHVSHRPARVIVPVLLDALSGLQAAHDMVDDEGRALSLVHRDISPENLLIGVDGHCRLIDFGIAQARGAVQTTQPGEIRGKPAYMSPEQVTGQAVDLRSDLFSAGVVLYNALTGRRLFDGASHHATMYNILKRVIPPPSRVGLRPPPCFDAVCLQALQRDPERRFQSALEMSEALRTAALESGMLGAPSEVARMVAETFGGKLQQRRDRTREFVRGRTQESPQVVALPELTLSVSSMQPVLTPTRTERHGLLTFEELSGGRESSIPTAEAVQPPPSTSAAAPLPNSIGPTEADYGLGRDRSRLGYQIGIGAGLLVFVGAAILLGSSLADEAEPAAAASSEPSVASAEGLATGAEHDVAARVGTSKRDDLGPGAASSNEAQPRSPTTAERAATTARDSEERERAAEREERAEPAAAEPESPKSQPEKGASAKERRREEPAPVDEEPPGRGAVAAPRPNAPGSGSGPIEKVESNPYLRAE